MSSISGAAHDAFDFDFWKFVNCCVCHLRFASTSAAPPVPFWITECGHVICNNHLNSNQRCPQCGSHNIQLMPLQHDIEEPMSEYFRSLPHVLDGVANAVKFQQESVASLVRHHKDRAAHFSSTSERLRNERNNLRRENEELKHRITLLEQGGDPSTVINSNGKRLRSDPCSSSPKSGVVTAPDRLTLSERDYPNFTSGQRRPIHSDAQSDRPGTSRFAHKPTRIYPPRLSHDQSGSLHPEGGDSSSQHLLVTKMSEIITSPQTNAWLTVWLTGRQISTSRTGLPMKPPAPINGRVAGPMGPPPTPQKTFSFRTPQTPSQSLKPTPTNANLGSTRSARDLTSNRFEPASTLKGSVSSDRSVMMRNSVGRQRTASGSQRKPFVPGKL
ncbi:hypothetical protein CONPUDRAFT_141814 [Coniophora puteana RWD-64-598 SS2]|uniref:RING-type domain-containing protein n=1 Tax=Coniophora puteana (strain RWD-64-598) TaxID=741705 RepID=A0A5M3N196_CONPW|nr:uncharacterized protein CONPUDRAFT_141814 [Coniophora puteana RWD-64-598 SS2]EIW85076.1 hypothetical protein CONPUDRAFT_141814 [Coniophora puteana RWD-64-598 SS2]